MSDWAVDVALFVFAAGLGGLTLGYVWHSHGAVLDDFDVAFGVLACLALWARRSMPVAVLAASRPPRSLRLLPGPGLSPSSPVPRAPGGAPSWRSRSW